MMKRVEDIRMGDEVFVNLGKGKVRKTVDQVDDLGTTFKIYLFTTFGKRPCLHLARTSQVEIPE